MLMALTLWAGAGIANHHSQGFGSWWLFAVIGVGVVPVMASAFRRAFPATSMPAALVVGVVLGTLAAGFGAHMVFTEPRSGWGSRVIVYGFAAVLVLNGIRLLVRQWSWQRTAPWLLPALLPLTLGFLPSLGLGLHTFYLDAFGLNLEDVDVPRAYQLLASVKFTACMSLWLAALALLGYMKHLHLYVKDRWFGNVVLVFVSVVLLLQGALELGMLSAARAGSEAVAAAQEGRTPGAYYGITPEWVCVHPIGRVTEIPVEGGEFVPSRPYLKVGDAGGTVVLWDAGHQQALKVAKDKLRIVPESNRTASCG
jgi:MFS family permease